MALKQDILPALLADKPDDYVFRVWVAGCATGEEAYSIAIVLRELMDEKHYDFKVQLYSTDLDDDAIAIARAGFYPPNIAQDISPERLRRFFIKEEERLPGEEGNSRDGGVRHPERHQGSAFHQARSAQLPQPDDLSGTGTAKPPDPGLSLRAQAGRRAVSVAVGEHRQPYRPVYIAQPQVEILPRHPHRCLNPSYVDQQPELVDRTDYTEHRKMS